MSIALANSAQTAVQTKAEVLARLARLGSELRSKGVRRCGVFGSLARDEVRPESDVDLLVEFSPEAKSFDNFMAAAEMLESALGRRVELVTPESLSPHLGPQILREVVYASLGN